MYLIVFTRKRLLPLVRRISPLLPGLAVIFLISLAATVVWLQLRSAELREQTSRLAGQISGYDNQLAEVRTDTPVTSEQLESEILIDLHPPPATPERTGPYAIQLASLHSRAEALRMAGGLSGTVGRELVVQRAVINSSRWYRVLIEPFPGNLEAKAYADSLRAAGRIRDFVLQRLPEGWRRDPDYTLISN